MCWQHPPGAQANHWPAEPSVAGPKAFFPLPPDTKPACKKACQSLRIQNAQAPSLAVQCNLISGQLSSAMASSRSTHSAASSRSGLLSVIVRSAIPYQPWGAKWEVWR